jgi:pantoate--beta-alanine ligase
LRIIRTIAEMAAFAPGDTGFVPTMGAFHEGHLALMREARGKHANVCVSLFVNPLQFGRGEDLASYPRDEDRDFHLAKEIGVDVMFAPASEEMYQGQSTLINVADITDYWEGQCRPRHFDGVATVVAKLFNIVRPRVAYFGWKDLQQCLVVRRMVEDLNIPLSLSFLETVREPDGLAMSSRNVYLTPEERSKAPQLYRTLGTIKSLLELGGTNPASVDALLSDGRLSLERYGFAVDYLEVVSLADMKAARRAGEAALIVGARLGTTRLIDNCRLKIPQG